jgi:alkanesulfonate monooxygenase SsuD/methylene tetrahydromethanopterin reductase-like flavin-dependent oxidoreductase (luciferase family)
MTVDFGLALVERHPKTALNQWMHDLDGTIPHLVGRFKSLWMTDHLFWGEQFAYECWTVLSFLAAKWPQFDVGPMVMGQNYRNPALLAKMAATLQVLSEGRHILGIGAGWKEDEYRGYGYTMPSPGARLEQLTESLEIIKALFTQPGKISYQGKHYWLDEGILEPKPQPVPPICVGVKGDKALAIAAKYGDWWNISDAPIGVFTDRMRLLDKYCEDIQRDPKSLRRTWFGRIVTGTTAAEIEARATTARDTVYTTNNAFVGTPAQIVESMAQYVALGCDYFMVDIVGLPNNDLLNLVLDEIVTPVQKLR